MAREPAATIVTRVYEPEGGAAAFRLANLARALERRGFTVTVLTTRAPGAKRSTATVKRFPVLRDRSGAVRGYVQYLSFDIPLFFRLLFHRRPDVVIVEPPPTTGVVARMVCGLRRIPYSYYSADVATAALRSVRVPRFVARTVEAMERWALRGARVVLAISEGVVRELGALGIDERRITVVGTGIDTEKFTAHGDAVELDAPYLVYAGTMSEFQGAGIFVEAFARVAPERPDARLVFIGGGVEVDRITRSAAALGDRVTFSPYVPADEAARWMRGAVASLASVRPGHGYDFAFPTKALASASCGTPVIFAGAGPLRDVVRERRLGWSTDWNADAVAAAMREALDRGRIPLDADAVHGVESEYSLRAVADRAAAAIQQSIGPAGRAQHLN